MLQAAVLLTPALDSQGCPFSADGETEDEKVKGVHNLSLSLLSREPSVHPLPCALQPTPLYGTSDSSLMLSPTFPPIFPPGGFGTCHLLCLEHPSLDGSRAGTRSAIPQDVAEVFLAPGNLTASTSQ